MLGYKKNKKLHQKIANHDSRTIPDIPKEYFTRKHVPPPFLFNGKPEDQRHYEYKIFLGERLRDINPYWDIQYEFTGLPSFFHERHNKFVNYQLDIFIEIEEPEQKLVWYSDIEINGGIHYKNDNQILKNKERKDLIYPVLQKMIPVGKTDYQTIASYIIIEVDDFEYRPIEVIVNETILRIWRGGVYSDQFFR